MRNVLTVRLYEPYAECRLCGEETICQWCVPMYEGNLLSNNFQGEWFGAPACQSCHDKHARNELPTFDHLYPGPRPLFEALLQAETSRSLRILSLPRRAARQVRHLHWI